MKGGIPEHLRATEEWEPTGRRLSPLDLECRIVLDFETHERPFRVVEPGAIVEGVESAELCTTELPSWLQVVGANHRCRFARTYVINAGLVFHPQQGRVVDAGFHVVDGLRLRVDNAMPQWCRAKEYGTLPSGYQAPPRAVSALRGSELWAVLSEIDPAELREAFEGLPVVRWNERGAHGMTRERQLDPAEVLREAFEAGGAELPDWLQVDEE